MRRSLLTLSLALALTPGVLRPVRPIQAHPPRIARALVRVRTLDRYGAATDVIAELLEMIHFVADQQSRIVTGT